MTLPPAQQQMKERAERITAEPKMRGEGMGWSVARNLARDVLALLSTVEELQRALVFWVHRAAENKEARSE